MENMPYFKHRALLIHFGSVKPVVSKSGELKISESITVKASKA